MNTLKNNKLLLFIMLIHSLLASCQQDFSKDNLKRPQADLVVTTEGIFYKGTQLLFEVPVSIWEKVLGKARVFGESDDIKSYVWDDLGITVSTMPHDNSQEWSAVKVRQCYIYFRNLDSKAGRTGNWTRYVYTDHYYNIKPEDWQKDNVPLSAEKLEDIKYLNSKSKKKSDFDLPYKTHTKPVFLEDALIDSTMTIQDINSRREIKKTGLFHYAPARGGINNSSSARDDTSGSYSGHYKTGFGNEKNWYSLDIVNWEDEIVYLMIRQLSPDEMKQ